MDDPNDILRQFDRLKALSDGWLAGRGIAPPPAGLDWLAGEFEARYPGILPHPHIYPVAEGGIRLEWTIGPREASLEIDLDHKTGEWHALDLDTDRDESRAVDLGDEAGWGWLIGRLTEMVGASPHDGRYEAAQGMRSDGRAR